MSILREEKIKWNSDSSVSFSDFKSKKKENSDAVSSTDVEYKLIENDSNFSLYLATIFYPKRSYVNYKCTKDTILLKHENLHFAITEVYSRQFRKLFIDSFEIFYHNNKFNVLKFQKYINAITFKEVNKEQKRYDDETKHGTNYFKQMEWEMKILSELQKFSKYTSVIIIKSKKS